MAEDTSFMAAIRFRRDIPLRALLSLRRSPISIRTRRRLWSSAMDLPLGPVTLFFGATAAVNELRDDGARMEWRYLLTAKPSPSQPETPQEHAGARHQRQRNEPLRHQLQEAPLSGCRLSRLEPTGLVATL